MLLIFTEAEGPPYFYFRSSWPRPTDLESGSRDAHLAVTVSTKFEIDTTIRCLVIALLLLIRYVTLWPWPLTFWLLVSGHTWRVTWSTPPRSSKILRLSVLELWVLTSPIGCHWQERAGHLEARFQGEGVVPLPIYWYHWKGNWMLYNFVADSFYIMKLWRRLFVLHCRSRPKYDTSMHFDSNFEEVRGGVEPW